MLRKTAVLAGIGAAALAVGACGGEDSEEFASQSDWCDRVGYNMTRDQVVEIMGEPFAEYGVQDDAQPQIQYNLDSNSQVTAFLDTDGYVDEFNDDCHTDSPLR